MRLAIPVAVLAPLLGLGCERPTVDPAEVRFGGRTYQVTFAADGGRDRVHLVAGDDRVTWEGAPRDLRHLSPCPRPVVVQHDLDGDERRDVALYTCGLAEVHLDRPGLRLSGSRPRTAERKEGRWIKGDPPEVEAWLRRLDDVLGRHDEGF